MKVFLLSDLVIHELVSMQLEGKWLTSEQFAESASLWASRHGLKNKLSKESLEIFQREAIEIAERLAKDIDPEDRDSPLKRLLLDISAVNYADPVSARALAASLEVCRAKLCDCCSQCAGNCDPTGPHEDGWRCHPALRVLLCGRGEASNATHGDSGGQDPALPCSRIK